MKNVAVFASGAGSNARQIIRYFKNHRSIRIAIIVCNKPGAGVLSIAESENIPYMLIEKEKFLRGDGYLSELQALQIQWIILAGFLWKLPGELVRIYSNRIINIHPALLPKFGGKGMYGQLVHQAVLKAKEKETGITIHYVDELYDNGKIIFQEKCNVDETDTIESIAEKVHQLEHAHFPRVIEEVILKN